MPEMEDTDDSGELTHGGGLKESHFLRRRASTRNETRGADQERHTSLFESRLAHDLTQPNHFNSYSLTCFMPERTPFPFYATVKLRPVCVFTLSLASL